MANSAINQSASIIANNGAAYQQANNNIFNAISQAADMWQQMQMKKQASLDAMRMKQADILTDPEKASQMILTKAYQLGPENLTPADKAAFEAAQKVLGAKVAQNPLTGTTYSPYQPIDLNGIAGPTGLKVGSPAAAMFTQPAVTEEKLPAPNYGGVMIPPRTDGSVGSADQFKREILQAPSVLGKAPEKVVKDTSAVSTSPTAQMEQVKADIDLNKDLEKSGVEYQRKQREAMFNTQKQFSNMVADFGTIDKTVDKAIGQSNKLNTGAMAGDAGKGHFGSGYITGGNDLNSTLKTIQADSAFGTLQDMRNASPTGGALGAVSERELDLLSKAKTSLEQSQSEGQLDENLRNYKEIRRNAIRNVAEAFKEQFGDYPKGYDPKKFAAKEEANTGGAPKKGDVVDGYVFLGGDPSKRESWKRK